MGKVTGFLEWARAESHRRPIDERLRDWREVELLDAPAETRKQGGRCMDCGVPFCTQGCPLGNPIPDFAHAVWTDRWRAAHEQLQVTNDFPEFTGRLCPAPCEAACVLAVDGSRTGAVTIEHLSSK
jgi:glutamate synthase (NADPH/NADH) small chain